MRKEKIKIKLTHLTTYRAAIVEDMDPKGIENNAYTRVGQFTAYTRIRKEILTYDLKISQ